MTVTRVRVTSERLPHNFYKLSDRDKGRVRVDALNNMIRKFRKACADYGILTEFKMHEFYEKPSDKRRREKKQARSQAMKENRQRK